jgi:hypothetical protein
MSREKDIQSQKAGKKRNEEQNKSYSTIVCAYRSNAFGNSVHGPLARPSCRCRRGRMCQVCRMRLCRVRVRESRHSRDVRIPVLEPAQSNIPVPTNQPVPNTCTSARMKRKGYALVARWHRVPYVHVPIVYLSRRRRRRRYCGSQRRPYERRVCFRTLRRPVRRRLMACGRLCVDRPCSVLMRLMTVRMSLSGSEPCLRWGMEHVTRNTPQLIAVGRQVRVREGLRLRRVGQNVRRGLLCERFGRV